MTDLYFEMDDLKDSILRFNEAMPFASYWMGEAWRMFREYLEDWREEVRDYAERCLMSLEERLNSPGEITLDEDEETIADFEIEEIEDLSELGLACACVSCTETEEESHYVSMYTKAPITCAEECEGDTLCWFEPTNEAYLVGIHVVYGGSYKYEISLYTGEEWETIESCFCLSGNPVMRDLLARVGEFTHDLTEKGFYHYE